MCHIIANVISFVLKKNSESRIYSALNYEHEESSVSEKVDTIFLTACDWNAYISVQESSYAVDTQLYYVAFFPHMKWHSCASDAF